MDRVRREYGDDSLDGLVPPSHRSSHSSLELEDNGNNDHEDYDDSSFAPMSSSSFPATTPKRTLLFYLATLSAFIIIYRSEVFLGVALSISIGIAISTSYRHHHKKFNKNPFDAAQITHDYSEISSKYDLTLGSIDHWCLRGGDNACRCEDPLEPMSRRSNPKWEEQHTENMKAAQAAMMKLFSSDNENLEPNYDDKWVEGYDDDWIYGEGSRFGNDDYRLPSSSSSSSSPQSNFETVGYEEEDDDGYGVLMERPANDTVRSLADKYELDVVFIGDSITEQRQGTSKSRPDATYTDIKEVFDKTFTKEKGGEFNGIAMGISGDTSPNLLWRLMNGEMPYGLTPKVWWVGIGINDLSMTGCSEEVVLLGILRVVEEIQLKNPESIIVINSLLPVQRNTDGLLEHSESHHKKVALKQKENNLPDDEMSDNRMDVDLWPSIVAINDELSKFASKHTGIKFFNADSVFAEKREDGKYMKLDLFTDAVHPNLAGHKKWNSEIKKRLHEILKDGART